MADLDEEEASVALVVADLDEEALAVAEEEVLAEEEALGEASKNWRKTFRSEGLICSEKFGCGGLD